MFLMQFSFGFLLVTTFFSGPAVADVVFVNNDRQIHLEGLNRRKAPVLAVNQKTGNAGIVVSLWADKADQDFEVRAEYPIPGLEVRDNQLFFEETLCGNLGRRIQGTEALRIKSDNCKVSARIVVKKYEKAGPSSPITQSEHTKEGRFLEVTLSVE